MKLPPSFSKHLVGCALMLFCLNSYLFAQETTTEEEPEILIGESLDMNSDNEPEVYMVVEEPARFPGGDLEMMKFMAKNLVYPEEARRKNIEGRVIVKFIVRKDGSISDIEVLRDIGAGCGEESARVLALSPKWIAGKQRGKNVDVFFTMPVMFKLEGKKGKRKRK